MLAHCLPAAADAGAVPRFSSAASSLDAELLVGFPDGDGSRTLLQVVVAVPAARARLNEYGFYNLERDLLTELAERTGGRSSFVDDAPQLRAAYAEIDRELRARYLLAYHSTHAGGRSFREVEVEVAAPRLTPRTIRGYYP